MLFIIFCFHSTALWLTIQVELQSTWVFLRSSSASLLACQSSTIAASMHILCWETSTAPSLSYTDGNKGPPRPTTSTYYLIKPLFINPVAFNAKFIPFVFFCKIAPISEHLNMLIVGANTISITRYGYNDTTFCVIYTSCLQHLKVRITDVNAVGSSPCPTLPQWVLSFLFQLIISMYYNKPIIQIHS